MNRRDLFPAILVVLGLLHLGACTVPAAPPDVPRSQAANVEQAITTEAGGQLPIRSYGAVQHPKAVLLAVHGFNDYSRSFEDVAHYLAHAGIKTIAYDQRGFGGAPDRGKWAGTQVMVDDFLAILHSVRRSHPDEPLFVLGESMGGAVIAVALTQVPDVRIDGVILSSPAIWSRDTMPWYQRFGIWVGARLAPAMTLSSSEHGIVPSDNVAMLAEFARDPLVIRATRMDTLDGLGDLMDQAFVAVPGLRQRALLIYGLRDVMIPRRPMMALLARWPHDAAPNFRFGLYPQGYHTLLRDLQRVVVWKDIVSWMLDPDATLPSGFERERSEVLRQLQMPGDD